MQDKEEYAILLGGDNFQFAGLETLMTEENYERKV